MRCLVQVFMDELITLDYGSGGKKTSRLIESMIVPRMNAPELSELGDGAILGDIAFSTDSFVIDPIFFPGGDIGKLSVCGTVNDISMCGAKPEYLSCALIIEEGMPSADLDRILASMAETARLADVKIVTGDTKVVEKGRGDKVYINTAGIGRVKYRGLSPKSIREGDSVIVSGTVGDHGTAIMLARSNMMQGTLKSDCAPLNGLCEAVLTASDKVRVLRDPTRGGVATTLNEFTEGSPYSIEISESYVPVNEQVRAACDMLGLDPLYCANEGKLLCIVASEDTEKVLEAMKKDRCGTDAAVIGSVTTNFPGKVVIHTQIGGSRILQKLAGAQLPRIC